MTLTFRYKGVQIVLKYNDETYTLDYAKDMDNDKNLTLSISFESPGYNIDNQLVQCTGEYFYITELNVYVPRKIIIPGI